MKKNKLIIISVVVFGILICYTALNINKSLKTVFIDVRRPEITATILDKRGSVIQDLSGATKHSVRLQKGDYSITPRGAGIASNTISFTVSESGETVVVDPGYSRDRLQTLLTQEQEAITSLLNATYSGVIGNFTINKGSLYGYGDWYATTLVEKSPGPGANGDTYRTVLRKENDTWKLVATPAIVLSTQENPSVPKHILDAVNSESGYE